MSKPPLRSSLFPILLIGAATLLWLYESVRQLPAPAEAPTPAAGSREPPAAGETTGPYETFRNCTLLEHRSNDGDSFLILLPNGRKKIFRLYFVDAPESDFRTYRGGKNNHRPIHEQATALGGITPRQSVKIGKEAKSFTLNLLKTSRFTLHTVWHSPFKDGRYQAFLEIPQEGRLRLLHELLVENGLARIYTRGAELPDGTSVPAQRARLVKLEKSAKTANQGAWRF